jgi:hypothetical protein
MMNRIRQPESPQSPADCFGQLADAIDGIVDFGMTICFMDEDKMAGRAAYVAQECDKVRLSANIVNSFVEKSMSRNPDHSQKLRSTLLSNVDLFLGSFLSLSAFRKMEEERVGSKAKLVQKSWEAIHQSLRESAVASGVFDQSWYDPILQRQETYRNTLSQIGDWFREAKARGLPSSRK